MQCSSCSAVVKPVVAVDIDGTLGDYHSHFLEFARNYLGPPYNHPHHQRPIFRGDKPFSEWFANAHDTDVRTFRDIKLAYRQGAQKRSMPAYFGACDFAQRLVGAGAEVWLTTTRPYLRLDGVDPDTRAWLQRHDIHYDGLLYDEDKYAVLAERVDKARVVAVVDDLIEQVLAAERIFGASTAFLRENGYNAAHAGFYPWTVNNLQEAGNKVLPRINRWREEHA